MYQSVGPKGPDYSPLDWPGFIVVSVCGGIVSTMISGFLFGTGTNVYHLPIVVNLYDEPQYANDTFIQSLRYFFSGLWLLLRGSDRWIDPYWLFLILAVFSRILSFAGFIACASLVGIVGRKERAFLAALLSATLLLRGGAVGSGGLFSNYFTHSEVANGLFLIALYLSIGGGIAASIGLTGVTFFVNAFMGAWTAAVVGVIILMRILRGNVALPHAIAHAALGICIAGPFVGIVIGAMLSNPEFGNAVTFDYTEMLGIVAPHHFFIESIDVADKAALLFTAMAGGASFILIDTSTRLLLPALITACAIFVAGIIVPHITHAPLIMNLHLLREGAFIQILSVLGITALAASWLFQSNPVKNIIASAIAVTILANPLRNIGLGSLAIILVYVLFDRELVLFRRVIPKLFLERSGFFRMCTVLTVMCFMGILFFKHQAQNAEAAEVVAKWARIGTWARANTAQNAVFLIPVAEFRVGITLEEYTEVDSAIFEFSSHRRVWVEAKRGSAAMWFYPYYHEWRRRRDEVLALPMHQDRLRYAQQNGLSYVVERCATAGGDASVIFAAKRLCVYPALSAAPAADASKAS